MKVLFKRYTSYGKGDNECLDYQWVDEDTPETRNALIEEYDWVDWDDGVDNFINGKTNSIYYHQADDWDSPTGGRFVVCSKEKAFEEVEVTYKKAIEKLNKLFGEEK